MHSIRWQVVLGTGLGCLLGAGCGATGITVPGGDTGTGTSSTGGSTSGGVRYQGTVTFGIVTVAGKTGHASGASFSVAPPSPSASTCAGGTQQGSCCYVSAAAASALAKTAPATDISAGTLTLQDSSSTLASLPFNGQGYPTFTTDTVHSLVWNPGDQLGVVAAGASDGVGPFTGTVVAPAPLQALSPDVLTLATLPRSSDFHLTWTGIVSGTVVLIVGAVSASSGDGVIVCTGSSADGSLEVPAGLLGDLPSGDRAVLELIMENLTSISAPNATIQLGAAAVLVGDVALE